MMKPRGKSGYKKPVLNSAYAQILLKYQEMAEIKKKILMDLQKAKNHESK